MGLGSVREEPALTSSFGTGNPNTTPAQRKPRRWRWRRWLVLLAVLGGLWLCRTSLLISLGQFLDVSETPTSTDYVMILGGDHNFRPAVAAALYKSGFAKQGILVPVIHQSPTDVQNGMDAQHVLIRKVLLKCGVDEAAIHLLDGEVDSTTDESLALGRFLDAHPGCSITIVTTDFHTRRARWLFQRHLGARASTLHFVAAPTEGFSARDWWHGEEGFVTYLNEYAKLGLYCFKN